MLAVVCADRAQHDRYPELMEAIQLRTLLVQGVAVFDYKNCASSADPCFCPT
jgi:hypothetical protein